MINQADYPARGRIIQVRDDSVIFAPTASSYLLHLATQDRYDGPVNEPIQGIIRASALKVWSVPSGGNFLIPITGPLRIVQGRVVRMSDTQLVLHVATHMVINLPDNDAAYDLARGPITVGRMVNVTCSPGGSFELLEQPATR